MSSKQYPLPLPHREAMAADDYIITASNHDAATWINIWPTWPSHCLMILGPTGSGKTHLLNLWLQNSGGVLVTAEELQQSDANSLAENKAIAIDGAEQITTSPEAQETLFHLYNLLRDKQGYLLLTSSVPPAQWNFSLADLRSRILASPAASIGVPDDELLTMLLVKQFHDRQIEVSAEVVTYLLPRIERTTAALRDTVANLDRASLAEGKGVTIALAKRMLEKSA